MCLTISAFVILLIVIISQCDSMFFFWFPVFIIWHFVFNGKSKLLFIGAFSAKLFHNFCVLLLRSCISIILKAFACISYFFFKLSYKLIFCTIARSSCLFTFPVHSPVHDSSGHNSAPPYVCKVSKEQLNGV